MHRDHLRGNTYCRSRGEISTQIYPAKSVYQQFIYIIQHQKYTYTRKFTSNNSCSYFSRSYHTSQGNVNHQTSKLALSCFKNFQSSSHPEILTPDVLSRQQRLRFNVYTDTIQELDADGSLGNADMYTEEIQKM
jgi:hypothetical protein